MFYPVEARVPEMLQADEFLVRPLRASDVALDYDAVISSREELLVGSGGTWPREGFTLEENLADLEGHEREHSERVAFTYTVMNPTQTECLGCIYINPLERLIGENAAGGDYLHDATGYMDFWVRQSRLADDLDQRLLEAVISWFQSEWAFAHVAFICLKAQERQVRLFEEARLRYLYTLKPKQAYLGDVVAYAIAEGSA